MKIDGLVYVKISHMWIVSGKFWCLIHDIVLILIYSAKINVGICMMDQIHSLRTVRLKMVVLNVAQSNIYI